MGDEPGRLMNKYIDKGVSQRVYDGGKGRIFIDFLHESGLILSRGLFQPTVEMDSMSSINDIFSGKLFIRIHTTLFC